MIIPCFVGWETVSFQINFKVIKPSFYNWVCHCMAIHYSEAMQRLNAMVKYKLTTRKHVHDNNNRGRVQYRFCWSYIIYMYILYIYICIWIYVLHGDCLSHLQHSPYRTLTQTNSGDKTHTINTTLTTEHSQFTSIKRMTFYYLRRRGWSYKMLRVILRTRGSW